MIFAIVTPQLMGFIPHKIMVKSSSPYCEHIAFIFADSLSLFLAKSQRNVFSLS